jgi:hypothetical protein
MPKEVCSPISRSGSKVGSHQPMSPGAFSNPSRGDCGRRDSEPEHPAEPSGRGEQPVRSEAHRVVSRMSQEPEEPAPIGPRAKTTGPED